MICKEDKGYPALEILRAILSKLTKADSEVARGISIIEENNFKISDLELIAGNQARNQAKRIGITGAPGIGKSTFLNRLLLSQDFTGYKVAVIAIDPSSNITKGAVLGDRIRITESSIFETIYFRSMATRGAYGGLNASIEAVLYFLEKCGFTLIFVETVGVGQNEVKVAESVDVVIHIIDSNTGDDVQMEKAGLMEVSDIFFVNTRDGNLNSKFITILKSFASNSRMAPKVGPEVIVGSAISGEGFEELWNLLHRNQENSLQIENR